MRKISKIIYCDKCGKVISKSEYSHSISIGVDKETAAKMETLNEFLETRREYFGDLKDFCASCTKSFYEWLKDTK